MQHFINHPTCTEFVCGAAATGRRNSRTDVDVTATTCARCIASDDYLDALTYSGYAV